MSPSQEANLKYIKAAFAHMVEGKYRTGDAEHQGDLTSLPITTLLDHAIDEAIDQVVYLLTLRRALGDPWEEA